MRYWQFMDYWTDGNPSRNLIREWYLGEDAAVQAEFENVINILEGQKNWDGLQEIQPMEREHVGLWEIRFNVTTTKNKLVHFGDIGRSAFVTLIANSFSYVAVRN